MSDEDPDAPAMTIANIVFGASPTSRLFQRIRVREGLSYGISSQFSASPEDRDGRFMVTAMAAPQDMPRVETAFKEELAKAWKDGFTAEEVEAAKRVWLERSKVARSDDGGIASTLAARERWGRTMGWDARLEADVAALTARQVSEAFRRSIDPATFSFVKAGDFKKASVHQ
jgi:zinc protease